MEPRDRIIVALDVQDIERAIDLVEQTKQYVGGYKVGLEFITSSFAQLMKLSRSNVPQRVERLQELFLLIGNKLMWDGKFDDIENTIAGAVKGLQPLVPALFTVHASAGEKALAAAVKHRGDSKVLGVTILTSIHSGECEDIFGNTSENKVSQFAHMLVTAGVDGIVCSAKELPVLIGNPRLNQLLRVIPGIRPQWASTDDQERVMTPAEAVLAGADYLVIGRPITQPASEIGTPAQAAQRIMEEIATAIA